MQGKNRRNLAKFVIILLGIFIPSFIFFGFWKGSIYAATSDTVNLQGKIVRNDAGHEGLNVTTGSPTCVVSGSGNDTCDFRIRYYDASSGGNLLLTEEFSNVEIGEYLGVFNLSLGSDISPTAGVYSSFSGLVQGEDDVYVEMGFDPSGSNIYTEVFTRMPLEATAYAIRAKYADTATGATEVPWSGLQDPTEDLTIEHSTRRTLFNWATGTGTDDLFTLTSNASATGTGALMNVQTGTGASLIPLRVRAGTVEGLMVDNQGRVGIGTTTPRSELEVVGSITLDDEVMSVTDVTFDGDTSAGLKLTNPRGYITLTPLNTGWAHIYTDRSNFIFNKPVYSIVNTFSSYNADLLLQRVGVTEITVGSALTTITDNLSVNGAGSNYFAGNVGIGTTPSYKLDVSGGTGIVGRFSGRVIGADAVNTNELVTKSQLDAVANADTSFADLTSGTNTTAAMVVGAGASLVYNGGTAYSGGINSNYLLGSTWAVPGGIGSTTPNTGAFTTLTASAGITNNHVTLATRMASTASSATQIPVFIADPSSTTRTLVTRTPAELRSDIGAGTGDGTVTSVGLSMPTQFSVTNSPVTSSGTLTAQWVSQAANSILAGPTSGVDAIPTFRALVNEDIPSALTGKTYNGLSVSTGTDTFTLTRGSSTLTRSGAHALTLTTTGLANATFPVGTYTLATTGDLHPAVTLAGNNYLTLSGQEITAGNINLASHVTGTLGVASGGTGIASYTAGDIIYASGATTLAKRTIGTAGQVLTVSGGLPVWTDVSSITEDNYVDSLDFNTSTGDLTVGRTGILPDLVESLDGRYGLASSLYGNWVIKDSSGDTGATVGSGEDVQFLNGTNITTTRSGRNVTFATVANPTFSTSVTTPLVIGTSNSLTLRPTTNAVDAIRLANAAGTAILSVDTTNSRVGIGTTSPSTQLHTTGGVRFAGITTGTQTTAVMADTSGNLSTRALGDLAFESSLAFLDLSDVTETTYTGNGGQLVAVNAGATGLEFVSSVPASSVPFSGITSGTNTSAAMVVGAGASLVYNGGTAYSGGINSNYLLGSTWAVPGAIGSTTPNTGAFTTVGIGTTSPSTQLHTTGGVRFAGITTGTQTTAVMADTSGNLSTRALGNLAFENSVAGDNWGTQVVKSDSTLTGTGVIGSLLGLNLANANTWTGAQTFSASTYFPGSGVWNSSGNVGIGTTPSYKLDVSGGTGIVGRFSGRVIGADAVNTNEFVTKSQLDSVGGSITTYWQRSSPNLSPINANDNILPNTSGNLGAAGSRWGTVYGNTGSFSSLQGNSTLTLLPSTDGINAVNIMESTGTTEIFSVDTVNSRIGIGTISPDSALHVEGQVKITGGTPGTNKVLTSDVAGLASWSDLSSLGGVVTSITGTTNQITASASTGDVVLSIPTDFRAPGTVNAVDGIYTGATAGTQRIDGSGNLLNIGTITFAGADVQLSRTAANVLSLASGDSFNLTSGSLQVGSTEVITSGRLVMAANGSATTPAFSFSADTNTGMYSGGTDILKFATAGADRVTVLANGNVGIGTTSPARVLDVIGIIQGSSDIYFGGSTGTYVVQNQDNTGLSANGNSSVSLTVDGSSKLTALTSGYVGIGTINPTSLFSVGASSQFQVDTSGDITKIKNLSYTWPTAHTTDGYLKNDGAGGLSWAEVNAIQSTGTPYGSPTEGPLAFWTSPTTISAPTPYGLYWDDINQYLGIGTNTPSAPLDIAGGTGGSLIKNSSGDITIEPAENLIISQGNVGMGTDNPLAKLHVKGNQILLKNEANADVGFVLDSGSTTTYRDVITFRDRGTDVFALEKTSTNAFQLYDYSGSGVSRLLFGAGSNSGISMRTTGTGDFSFINDTTTRVTIKSDGKVGIGTTTPGAKLSIGLLTGSAASTIFQTNAGSLGTTAGNSIKLASIGFSSANQSSLGIEALRTANGTDWTTTAINLKFDVDSSSPVNNALISLNSNGRIGIGTTSPTGKLTVAGSVGDSRSVSIDDREIKFRGDGVAHMSILGPDTGKSYITFQNTSNNSGTGTAGTDLMTILSSGNVGIRTTTPRVLLDVSGTRSNTISYSTAIAGIGGADVRLQIGALNGSPNYGVWIQSERNYEDTVFPLSLNPLGGNVGIGKANPLNTLELTAGGNVYGASGSLGFSANAGNVGVMAQIKGILEYYTGSGLERGALTFSTRGSDNILTTRMTIASNGYVTFANGHNDLAENYQTAGTVMRGSLVSINTTTPWTVTAANREKSSLVGVVTTNPGAVMDADGGFQIGYTTKLVYQNEKVPIALVGTAPTLVTLLNGPIDIGDSIGVSELSGFGAKMTTAGHSVGKALEKIDVNSCTTISSLESINWPEDDGKNSLKPCYILPNGTIVGKIMVAVQPSWYDPAPGELLARVEDIEAQLASINDDTNPIYNTLSLNENLNILTVDSYFVPSVNNTYDLGTSTNRWKDIYAQGIVKLGSSIDNGGIKYNPETKRLELSNDGETWIPLGSSTNTVLLSAQYPGSVVLDGLVNNIGEMTMNNTGLGNASMNYYQWESSESNLNDKEINITYQLPSDFKEWGSGGITLNFATESISALDNKVDLYVYEQNASGYDEVSEGNISIENGKWQTTKIEGSQLNMCNEAEDVCVIRVKMSSSLNNYARVGDIKIKYERTL